MKRQLFLSILVLSTALLLTACVMGGMVNHGNGPMQGMHGQMSSENTTSGTISNTMPMDHGNMPDMAGMMGMMDQMMTHMQGMTDGSIQIDQSHVQSMTEQMKTMMDGMNHMHTMMMGGMTGGTMGEMKNDPAHQREMQEMMGKMHKMTGMMEQMHAKMNEGSVEPAMMQQMQEHMAHMSAMMGMMQSMIDGSMPISDTMPAMDHAVMSMTNAAQPFDLLFIDSMIIHHQGAVEMAIQAQKEATKNEIKKMADAVITAQAAEIQQMQAWRKAWYPNAPATDGMGMEMGTMTVPASDKLYDLRFIEAMIPHHVGAIEMAKVALEKAEHPEIKQLAEAIITAQEGEITQMKTWQEAWSK